MLIQCSVPLALSDLEMPELCPENQDRKAVDKAKHHRMRNHADELPQTKQGEDDLQNTHEHNCGKQVLDAMLHHERDHDHRGGTGRS